MEGVTLRNGGGYCETAPAAGGLAADTSGEVALTRNVLSRQHRWLTIRTTAEEAEPTYGRRE